MTTRAARTACDGGVSSHDFWGQRVHRTRARVGRVDMFEAALLIGGILNWFIMFFPLLRWQF